MATSCYSLIFVVIISITAVSVFIFYFFVSPLDNLAPKEYSLSNAILESLAMSSVQSRRINSELLKKKWIFKMQNESLQNCPLIPPGLQGSFVINTTPANWSTLQESFPWLEEGGHGKPESCIAQHRVAILVPYRNRENQLRIFLNHMHSFLRRQQLDYAIIIVEPVANQTFNRAKLMNVGYMEAMKVYPWECFVFNDVDLLPENDSIFHSCPVTPRHMSSAIDISNYTMPYDTYFGGVTSMTVDQMRALNGFSNDYWGWGGEDDDLYKRTQFAGYNITRYPLSIGRYYMHKHAHAAEEGNTENDCRWSLLNATESRWQTSGLRTLNYKIEKISYKPLYMHVLADLFEEESKEDLKKWVKC